MYIERRTRWTVANARVTCEHHEQERQCAYEYNVTSRRVHETIFAVEKQ